MPTNEQGIGIDASFDDALGIERTLACIDSPEQVNKVVR